MSAPTTSQPILTDEELDFVAKAKQNYEIGGGLKPGGRGSTEKNIFLKCVTKFVMVHALAMFVDPESATEYDFARNKSTIDQTSIHAANYKKACIHLLISEKQLSPERRILGFGDGPASKFWRKYVLEGLLTHFGGDSAKGIDMISILCANIKAEGKKNTFNEWSGASVKQLGDDTVSEFKNFERRFVEILGPDGKPSSGKTWDSALEDFRRTLYQEAQGKKEEKKAAKQGPVENEEEEALHPSSDPYDKFAISSESVPDGWLPGGAHAWLLFVCYGTYGRNVYGTELLYNLKNQTVNLLDEVKTSRRENKKQKNMTSAASIASTVADDFRFGESKKRIEEGFERKWNSEIAALEDSIATLQKLVDFETKQLSRFLVDSQEYIDRNARISKREEEIQEMINERISRNKTKNRDREEYVRKESEKALEEIRGCPSPVVFRDDESEYA